MRILSVFAPLFIGAALLAALCYAFGLATMETILDVLLRVGITVWGIVCIVVSVRAGGRVIEHKGEWSRMVGRHRLRMGLCPRCNSDAPAVDRCHVCKYVLRPGLQVFERNMRQQFPPSEQTRADWWRNFVLGP